MSDHTNSDATSPVAPILAGANASEAELGGKAFNLIAMCNADLAVPGGVVLCVSFFDPWFAVLEQTAAWATFMAADTSGLGEACDALKAQAAELPFTDEQRAQLDSEFGDFGQPSDLFAVRSSSPQEDLDGSSFAGAYESVIGVARDAIEEAVKTVFGSALDARIVIYKRKHGIAAKAPRIAVIIQKQINSDVAGVGFSINPLNNDHDEAVFNANWGQGETVVSGLASADLFVVQRNTQSVVERTIGAKETSIWVEPDGGTSERQHPRHAQLCLTDSQVLALTVELEKVAAYMGKPTDIEWAIAEDKIYLLQARPITTHREVPEHMKTAPGEPRVLYVDMLSTVQGILEPMSPLGLSTFDFLAPIMKSEVMGGVNLSGDRAIITSGDGRFFAQLPNVLAVAGKERLMALFHQMDGLVGRAFSELDLENYANGRLSRARLILGAVSRMYRRVAPILRARFRPKKAVARWQEKWAEFRADVRTLEAGGHSLREFLQRGSEQLARFVLRDTVPLYPNGRSAMGAIRKLFPEPTPQVSTWLDALDRSLPGNVTVDMGLALYEMHQHLAPGDAPTAEILEQHILNGTAPTAFATAWAAFIETYGHRGIQEIDVASPRYRDVPAPLLSQVVRYVHRDPAQPRPFEAHERNQRERTAAYESLGGLLDGRKLASFEKLFARLMALGGFRETHKFVVVHMLDRFRQRLLREGETLARGGRLDAANDVFMLTLEDLERTQQPSFDVREAAAKGRAGHRRAAQCKQAFPLFDSRGRFHRPTPAPAKPGELAGQSISNGVASGVVRILHSPTEKPVRPGDVLVARATDPAWTPLFVNAEAIILEVGGPLQHGGLVAREYGKPCVSGILGVTEVLQEGERVEVDGTSGIIKRLDFDRDSVAAVG